MFDYLFFDLDGTLTDPAPGITNSFIHALKYFGMEIPNLEYFDSLIIAKRTWPDLESHRLTALGEYFKIEYLAHNALEDSRTCGQIIKFAADKWGVNSIKKILDCCETKICSF